MLGSFISVFISSITSLLLERVLNRFYGIRDFPYLKLGIRDLRAKSRRDSGLKLSGRVRMPEMTLGITGLHEILSRDYGIEGPYTYWGPSLEADKLGKPNNIHLSVFVT